MAAFSMDEFYRGECTNAYEYFGAHPVKEDDDAGILFRVYAPAAWQIEIIGDFNGWNGWNHKMNKVNGTVYELYVDEARVGQRYKFRVYHQGGNVVDKADPYAFRSELRPDTASIVTRISSDRFHDEEWIKNRSKCYDKPMNIYEMHMGSWIRPFGKTASDGAEQWFHYDRIGEDLVNYLKDNNYTHVEVMPLAEYPFDGSWGYQVAQYYSATSRYGTPDELVRFVDLCHINNIGVIIDFAFVHFVKDNYSLGNFDGTCLYEYPPSDVNQSQWGSYNFNLAKYDVRSYLMSCAAFWLETYHFDGIRMDAINNGIYWMGDKNRGVNDRSVEFFKKMNQKLNQQFENVILIAEDSSDYPGVTRPVEEGGLGFDYKWDMGWMNDTLKYFKLDPLWRKGSHNQINWSMAYFYFERFILPLSHDEVVHGKATIVQKMFGGDYYNKFAQARLLYAYMMTHPGKKLNFMGNELGMFREWDETREMDWFLIKEYPMHQQFHEYFRDLCGLIVNNSAFYERDYKPDGFLWIDADNANDNMFAYFRISDTQKYAIFLNMSPVRRDNYRVGMNYPCTITEVLNSDSECYGGSGAVNPEPIKSEPICHNQWYHSLEITLPPFGAAIFEVKEEIPKTDEETEAEEAAEKTEEAVEEKPAKKKCARKSKKKVKSDEE